MACDKGYRIGGWGKLFNYHQWAMLNNDIQGSLKKFSLFFRQAEMVSVIVWFLDHFTLDYVPSVNRVWIIAFVCHLHVWVTKFELSLIFFKMPILTSNNVIWMLFSAIFFYKAQHIVKIFTTGYVPVFYDVINLSIKFKILCWCFSFVNSRACIWLPFFWMTEANFWTSRGKTVSTTHSTNDLAPSLLHLNIKQ